MSTISYTKINPKTIMATTSLPPPTTSTFKPLNREPCAKTLISSPLTCPKQAYDRNHGPIPHLSAETHKITISDTSTLHLLSSPLSLSISDLQSRFTLATVTCALQCAGNRRHTMRTKIKEVNGIDWGEAAVMNCAWTGVRLTDVLSHIFGPQLANLTPEQRSAKHVAFACRSVATQDDDWYGSSIVLDRALDPEADVLLALQQNHQPLTPEHGFPVRLIVPGIAGARSVKWLDSITVQDRECQNFYMQRDYKILPPQAENVEQAKDWWDKVEPLMEMPINSVVIAEETVERDAEGQIEVSGYALPGGDGGPVVKVEIRVDDGGWEEAQTLQQGGGKWAWVLWKWKGSVGRGKHIVWSRAMDRAGHKQDCERSVWNLRGIAYNGYGEAEVEVV